MNIYRNMLLHAGILRAPVEMSGMGSFGGGTGGGDDSDAGDDDSFSGGGQQSGLIDLSNQDDEDADPLDDVFQAFGDGSDNEIDDTTQQGFSFADVPPEQITAMQTEIQSIIGKMTLSADAIPENFDPSDRQQFASVMNRTIQAAVAQSLNVVFKPVQLAMNTMASQTQQMVDQKIAGAQTGMAARSVIESKVPEINNPKYSAMVKTMDKNLQTAGKKPGERATILRKMLNQMGINDSSTSNGNGQQRRMSGGGNGQDVTRRQGKAALDSLFGAFTPPPRQQGR